MKKKERYPGLTKAPYNNRDKDGIVSNSIEQAFKESELKFRSLFESSGNGIFVIRDKKIIDCNPKSLEVFACPKEQLLGKMPHQLSPGLQKDGIRSRKKWLDKNSLALKGELQLFEWQYLRCDGKLFWAEVSLNRFKVNRKFYLLATIRDITKRRLAEKALHESEERYRALFEGVNEGILVADVEAKKYVLANPAVLRMLGYTHSDIEKVNIWDIHPVEYQEEVIYNFGALVRNERPLASNIPCRRKDGSVFYADIKASWATLDSRECLVSFLTDVSDRRDAQEALEASEERLRTILNSLQVGVVIIDAETRKISDCNPAAANMIGLPENRLIGEACRKYICRSEEECPILDQGQHINNSECLLTRVVGEEIPILKTVTSIKLAGDNYLLESFIDVSEKKRLEVQLTQSQKMEAVGRLAGGIAHDFNNLLMAISGHTELILMKMDNQDPMKRRIEEIKKAGERAAALTRQLLAFSRKQVLKPQVISLNQIISNIKNMLNRLIGEDITFITSMHDQLKNIKADAGQIDQIIMNLAINARDAMPNGGELIIETENVIVDKHFGKLFPEARPGEFVCLSIADDGIGMTQDMIQEIFEPFFTTKEGGTGLGLSVVYGIVKQHGGWIKIYSAPGIGSNFQIFFPVANDEEIVVDSEEEFKSQDLQGRGETILVVEDDESVRQVTVEALLENGYNVTEVSSAKEAMSIFKKRAGAFDLVFSDIVLPDETGVQLVERLTKIKPGIRVIFVSGYPGQKSQWADITKQGYPFLQKPYTLKSLLLTIRECIDRNIVAEDESNRRVSELHEKVRGDVGNSNFKKY